jgi:hypothetical protein
MKTTALGVLLVVAAGSPGVWIGCDFQPVGAEPVQGAHSGRTPQIDGARAHFMAGRFAAARDVLHERIKGKGDEGASAERDLPFLEAVAWGQFPAAIEKLGALHAKEQDFASADRLARLLALHGKREEALRAGLEAVACKAAADDKVRLLECILAGAPPGEASDRVSGALLELDPWNAVARSARFRSVVLGGDFPAARTAWRQLHYADLLAEEFYAAEAAAVESLFAEAGDDRAARWQLGRALGERHRWVEAAHCLRDAEDAVSAECRARAERFAVFARELDRTWTNAMAAGLADGKAKAAINEAVPQLCKTLGATSAKDLYAKLRDEHGLYLLLLSSGVTSLHSEATEILTVDEVKAPAEFGVGGVRRVVTGATWFRMAAVLSPLASGVGSKDVFRPDWPDSIVLHASYSIDLAANACAVALGTRGDPASELPLMADPGAAPGHVASAFMVGNQGNACFQRMRETIAATLDGRKELEPRGSKAWCDAFIGALARADLQASALHEMRHVADHRDGVAEAAYREFNAFLAELELAPAAARYQRLAIVATGGNPAAPSDHNETANFDLLVGLLTTLINDKEIAPQIDRTRCLQAQMHLLEPEEMAEIARRVAAARRKGGR